MVLAFLLFVCSVLISEKWGREWPWSVSPEAEPEAGVLGKRCTEGMLSGEISQRAREERSVGEGAKEGQGFPQGALEPKGHHRIVSP